MNRPPFKPNHICVSHPGMNTECFPIVGQPAFMQFNEKGTPKIAMEFDTDWISFEDTELFGDSEATFHLWGLRATRENLQAGVDKPLKPGARQNEPLGDDVFAWFFATVGHRVDAVEVKLLGSNRVQVKANLLDVTEETEKSNTTLTADVVLTETSDIEAKF